MKMIWHYGELVDCDTKKMRCDLFPPFLDNTSAIIQPHLTIHHLTKQAFPLIRADRDEICSAAAVIIFPQADGMAMVDVGVVFHVHLIITTVGAGFPRPPGFPARLLSHHMILGGETPPLQSLPLHINYAANSSFNSSSIGHNSSPNN